MTFLFKPCFANNTMAAVVRSELGLRTHWPHSWTDGRARVRVHTYTHTRARAGKDENRGEETEPENT